LACSADEHCPSGTVDNGGRCVYPGGDVVFPPIGGDAVVLVPADVTAIDDLQEQADAGVLEPDAAPSGDGDATNTDGSATNTTDGDSAGTADSDAPSGPDTDDAAASDTAAGSETGVDAAAPEDTGQAPGGAG
jgi:hypothetical protein